MHEFLHLVLHVTCSFALVIFREQSRASSLHPLLSSSVPASPAPAGSHSAAPPLLGQLDVPTFLFVLLSRSCCSRRHVLIRILIPTCLALVTVPYTRFDPSFTARGQSKPAQIRHCRSRSEHGYDLRHGLSILEFTSDVSSSTKYRAPPAVHTTRTRIPCDPCPSSCTSCSNLCLTK